MSPPRSLRILYSRMSVLGSLGVGLYKTLDTYGLRMPAQRLMAEECLTSAATLSRRLSEPGMLDRVIRLVVRACADGFPGVHHGDATAEDWLPLDDLELADARVWLAVQYLALGSEPVAEEVVDAWELQRERLGHAVFGDRAASPARLEAVHALVAGLTLRLCIDRSFTHDRAVAVVAATVDAIAAADAQPSSAASST